MADSNITRNAMAAAMKGLTRGRFTPKIAASVIPKRKKKSFPRSAFPIYAEHAV